MALYKLTLIIPYDYLLDGAELRDEFIDDDQDRQAAVAAYLGAYAILGDLKNSTWYYKSLETNEDLNARIWYPVSIFSVHIGDLIATDRKCYYDVKWHSLKNLVSG